MFGASLSASYLFTYIAEHINTYMVSRTNMVVSLLKNIYSNKNKKTMVKLYISVNSQSIKTFRMRDEIRTIYSARKSGRHKINFYFLLVNKKNYTKD